MLFGSKADRILAKQDRVLGELEALRKEVQSMSKATDRIKVSSDIRNWPLCDTRTWPPAVIPLMRE